MLSCIAVAISASLIFLLQPIVTKIMLPHFGGSTTIWVTASIVFQALLLLGYLYAFLLIVLLPRRARGLLHSALLVCSIPALNLLLLTRDMASSQSSVTGFVSGVSYVVVICCAVPFILLAATTPLMVAAYANSVRHKLFVYSNFGSFLALFAMPLLLEPWTGLIVQTRVWITMYLLTMTLVIASLLVRQGKIIEVNCGNQHADAPSTRISFQFGWFGWSALGAAFLAATNLAMSSLTPGATLVWMLPLAAYLLSFVMAFQPGRYRRLQSFPWVVVSASVLALALISKSGVGQSFYVAVVLFPTCLFGVSYFCHGELAQLQPSDQNGIGLFYVLIAAAGVIGGSMVAFGAPAFLPFPTELPLLLLLFGVFLIPFSLKHLPRGAVVIPAFFLAVVVWVYRTSLENFQLGLVSTDRNNYGLLRVVDQPTPLGTQRLLILGSTIHGFQFVGSGRENQPTSYFGETSGAARAIKQLRQNDAGKPLKIAVIGLGAGVMAAHCNRGDACDFFELNQSVQNAALADFSFLENAHDRGVDVNLRVGDGRKLFEGLQTANGYDLIVLDVYSDGMIPVHMITREAILVFVRNLTERGILAINISSSTFALEAAIANIGNGVGMSVVNANDIENRRGKANLTSDETYASNWMLLSRHSETLEKLGVPLPALTPVDRSSMWSDDYVHVLGALTFLQKVRNAASSF